MAAFDFVFLERTTLRFAGLRTMRLVGFRYVRLTVGLRLIILRTGLRTVLRLGALRTKRLVGLRNERLTVSFRLITLRTGLRTVLRLEVNLLFAVKNLLPGEEVTLRRRFKILGRLKGLRVEGATFHLFFTEDDRRFFFATCLAYAWNAFAWLRFN